MSSVFQTVLPFTLAQEGGYSAVSDDSGNWTGGVCGKGELAGTNLGVSAPAWAEWTEQPVTAAIMQALTVDAVTPFYAARYWNPVQGDQLPTGVNLSVFDMQVNAGANGARCLQRAAGMPAADVDGWIGPQTLDAIADVAATVLARTWSATAAKAVQAVLGVTMDGIVGPVTREALAVLSTWQGQEVALCCTLYDQQASYYRGLRKPEFLTGWLNRCAARLDAALKMVMMG